MPSSTRSSFVVMTKRCLSVRNHGAGRTDRAARLSPPARWQRSSSELHRGTRPRQREETSAPADTIRQRFAAACAGENAHRSGHSHQCARS
jgi:hypothetical protein